MPSITPKTLKTALEGRDASALIGFYVDDAVIQIIDQGPPWEVIVDQRITAMRLATNAALHRLLFLSQS